ncbi:zinc-containing alcohol dehydrogenase superfamily protein [Hyaloraphidium curvatum]|nr:zinc-containing alcohol dehydrogenase superfamily protein [Hyaloraphidium curvatum]
MSDMALRRTAALLSAFGATPSAAAPTAPNAAAASGEFRALVLESADKGKTISAAVKRLDASALPKNPALVKVAFSSINYKDGLAITGRSPIVRTFPHVPGIDIAGTIVEAPASSGLAPGDRVVLTGYGIGEGSTWGGLAEMARVKPEWLVKLPQNISEKDAVAIGTAGFTAMQCVMALQEHGVKPDSGEIVVTGAAGGVGSVAVAILAKLGYKVVAVSGRVESQGDYLKKLGASRVIDRKELEKPGKPIDSEKWAGAVDTVGGQILVNVLSQMKYLGSVAACGLAASPGMPNAGVFPFILRGVNLLGIDSVQCPQPRRQQVWARLAQDLPMDKLHEMTKVVGLEEAVGVANEIVRGNVAGRVVVDVNK